MGMDAHIGDAAYRAVLGVDGTGVEGKEWRVDGEVIARAK